MSDKKTAVVLCGIAPHASFIEKLKSRGYYTVLIDYLDEPPAAPYADIHVQESAFELDIVVRIAKEYEASFIAAPCIDQVNVVACRASEELGLPQFYGAETAVRLTDKSEMKYLLDELGIRTAKSVSVSEESKLFVKCGDLEYPLIVKPVDSFASVGVEKVESQENLRLAFSYAKSVSSSGNVLIEEFLQGHELSVYCFIEKGVAHIILSSDRYTYTSDAGIRCYATFSPAQISETIRRKALAAIQKIADALELYRTPFFIQFFHKGDNLWVTEFAGRTGGGFSFSTMLKQTGFNMFDAIIDAYEGIPVDCSINAKNEYSLIQILYSDYGVFGSFVGEQEILQRGLADEVYVYKDKGDEITKAKPARARVASLVLHSNSPENLLLRASSIMGIVDVIDVNGKPLLLKDVYLKPENTYYFEQGEF